MKIGEDVRSTDFTSRVIKSGSTVERKEPRSRGRDRRGGRPSAGRLGNGAGAAGGAAGAGAGAVEPAADRDARNAPG